MTTEIGPNTNLTTACLEPSFAFQSFDSVVKCLQEYGQPESDYLNDVLGVSSKSAFGVVMAGCIDQYCEAPDPDLGGCGANDHSKNYTVSFWDSPYLDFSACADLDESVNQDIGGIGVFISYIMQLIIIMYIWLAVRLLVFIPAASRFFRYLPTAMRWWMDPRKKTLDKERSQDLQIRLTKRFGHHQTVLQAMLVEFQEAQCFFMLSIQAAALIALSTGPQVFEATSFAQLESNVSAIALVALMGVVPVTFALWVLHKVGMNSWYTMFWSTISVALSNVTLYMGNSSPSATSLVTISSTDRLDKCGHYGPPLIYCYGYSGSTMGSYSPSMFILRIINYVSLAFYGIIVLMWLAPYLRRCMQKNEWSQHTYVRVHQVLTARWARAFGHVWTVFVELVSMLFCVVYGIYLTSRNFGAFDADSWSFGQIIAVTIWAPVICKYFYWAMFGTESYSAIRVPEPYKILRVRTSNILDTGSRSEDGERLFIHIPSTSDLNLGQSSTQVTDVELTSLKSRTTGMREEPEEKQARWKAREMN